MGKLIDADAAIDAIKEIYEWHDIVTKERIIEHFKQLPSIQPDTTTHDSIPAETGKNDGDRTSGDCISRQAVKDIFTELYGISAIGSAFDKYEWADICETTVNELPSVQPEIIRCKDCKYYKYGICMKIGANKSFHGFCDWAERGEQNG